MNRHNWWFYTTYLAVNVPLLIVLIGSKVWESRPQMSVWSCLVPHSENVLKTIKSSLVHMCEGCVQKLLHEIYVHCVISVVQKYNLEDCSCIYCYHAQFNHLPNNLIFLYNKFRCIWTFPLWITTYYRSFLSAHLICVVPAWINLRRSEFESFKGKKKQSKAKDRKIWNQNLDIISNSHHVFHVYWTLLSDWLNSAQMLIQTCSRVWPNAEIKMY